MGFWIWFGTPHHRTSTVDINSLPWTVCCILWFIWFPFWFGFWFVFHHCGFWFHRWFHFLVFILWSQGQGQVAHHQAFQPFKNQVAPQLAFHPVNFDKVVENSPS